MLCANDYEDSYWTGGMCYVKQQYIRSSWNDYRSNCLPGSPAIVDNLNDVSRWLEDLTPFCIGLHCAWWNWHNAGMTVIILLDISIEIISDFV